MRYTVTMFAGDNDNYAPGAFDRNIGKPFPIRDGDKRITGRLLSAVVDDSGESVRLTLDIPDGLTADQRKLTGRPSGRPPADRDRSTFMGG